MSELIYKDECYRIIAACFEVYKEKGCGFLEPVYQECLQLELGFHSVPFRPQMLITLAYKRHPLKQRYLADLICFDKILVELKAVSGLTDEHRAQVINYLHATGLRLGLLVNFGHHPKVEWERIVV
jgi:GxxExxY protein